MMVSYNPFIFLLFAFLFNIMATVIFIQNMEPEFLKLWIIIVIMHFVPLFFVRIEWNIDDIIFGAILFTLYNIYLIEFVGKTAIDIYSDVLKDIKNNRAGSMFLMKQLLHRSI